MYVAEFRLYTKRHQLTEQKEQNRQKYAVIKKYIKKYYHALII